MTPAAPGVTHVAPPQGPGRQEQKIVEILTHASTDQPASRTWRLATIELRAMRGVGLLGEGCRVFSGRISVVPWIGHHFAAAKLAAGGCILDMSAKDMRTLLISTSLLLASGTGADAQSGGREPRDPSKIPILGAPDEILKRGDDYLEQCMKDWDAATHMSKQDWRRTCQRVSQDRVKFLLDQAKKESTKK